MSGYNSLDIMRFRPLLGGDFLNWTSLNFYWIPIVILINIRLIEIYQYCCRLWATWPTTGWPCMKMWTLTLWEKLCGTTSTVFTAYGQSSSKSCDQRSFYLCRLCCVWDVFDCPRAATMITTTAAWTCCWSARWRCSLKPWPVTPSRPRRAFTTPSGDASDTPKRYEHRTQSRNQMTF